MCLHPPLNTHLHWVNSWIESHQPGCNSGCEKMKKVFSGPTQYGARLQTAYLCLHLKLKDLWCCIHKCIACK